MAPTMVIADPDWTYNEMVAGWADDGSLTDEQCREAADTEVAWLVNNTHDWLPGWQLAGDGEFSGPARDDALATVRQLLVEATDYVVEHLDEIVSDD